MIKITVGVGIENLEQKLGKKILDIFDTAMLDLADELQRKSPVGASKELIQGWDVIPAKRLANGLDIKGSVVINAEAAYFRIVGRGPGKAPPIDKDKIGRWVAVKFSGDIRSIAFAIARKIALKGTDRWIKQENILGLNRDGTFQQGSIVDKAKQEIIEKCKAIKI